MLTVSYNGWEATDRGGPYIDIGRVGGDPFDCVNCWDYKKGARAEDAPFTKSHLKATLIEWIDEYGQDFTRNGY